jgi:hypothetical protein
VALCHGILWLERIEFYWKGKWYLFWCCQG